MENTERLESYIRSNLELDLILSEDYDRITTLLDDAEELKQTVKGEDAFRRFCQRRLREYEGERCACGYDYCDVSMGRLPGKVRGADNFRRAIDDFLERHPEAIVLQELVEEFDAKQREYKGKLQQAKLVVMQATERSQGILAEGE